MEDAVYNKDFVKVDRLLESAGDKIKETANVEVPEDLERIDDAVVGQCAVFVAVYLGVAVYVDTLAWNSSVAWTKKSSSTLEASNLLQKKIVNNLITTVN